MPGELPATPVLETRRLILRPIRAEDAPAIQRNFERWGVVRLLTSRTPWPFPPDGAAANMPNALGEMARREQFHWAITLRGGTDVLIGYVNLWPDDGVSRDQRGFWLAPESRGRCLMGEAPSR